MRNLLSAVCLNPLNQVLVSYTALTTQSFRRNILVLIP